MTKSINHLFRQLAVATTVTLGLTLIAPVQALDVGIETTFITLGTNSGPIPNPARAQPANYLRYGNEQLLIDVGDGVSEQLGKAGIPLGAITSVFISHLHFDHTGGLFGFLGQRYQTINPSVVTIYGPPGTRRTVDGLLAAMQPMAENALKLSNRTKHLPQENINIVEMADGASVLIGKIAVTAAVNSHYILTDKTGEEGHSLSFRFDMPDRSIVYTGDTGPSAAVERLAKDVDLLVCEIMFPERALARLKASRPDVPPQALQAVMQHYLNQHMSPTEAGLMAKRSGAKSLLLTHVAIQSQHLEEAKAFIAEQYPGSVEFAVDLQRY